MMRWVRRLATWLHPGPRQVATGARDPLGPMGEREAAKLLRRKGYRILGRNLRVPMGEADILCRAPDRRTIVLVEVKARRVHADKFLPAPEQSVHAFKQSKLTSILKHLARANKWSGRPLRIDVVAVEYPHHGRPIIRHHEGVIRFEGKSK